MQYLSTVHDISALPTPGTTSDIYVPVPITPCLQPSRSRAPRQLPIALTFSTGQTLRYLSLSAYELAACLLNLIFGFDTLQLLEFPRTA